MKVSTLLFAVLAFCFTAASGQMAPVTPDPASVKPVPSSIQAKYEGGMFGFSKKQEGTLRFDDINERLIFFSKDGKEQFSLSYYAMQLIYPQSKSVTSTAGQVVRHIPLPGSFLGGFIKEKRRYLAIHFEDPDTRVDGVTSFRFESKDLLDSVLHALAAKAELTRRGEAFYRPKKEPVKEI